MHTISAKVTEWLDSDEYWNDIDQMRTAIMRDASHAENEATTASIFERELYHLIKTKTTMELSYVRESPVSQLTHRFDARQKRTSGRGRLDAVINNLVIEYKHYSRLKTKEQFLAAAGQVTDYLTSLHAAEGVKYNAILTDGLKISYFDFSGERVEHSMLSSLSNEDLDTVIRAILFNRKKQFVPDNIVRDFSISSQADSISKSVALTLYDSLKNHATDKTRMLYEEWKTLMHLSVDDNGKGNDIAKRRTDLSLIFSDTIDSPETEYRALYALQTTYAIIVKLIACKVIDKLDNNATHYYDLTNISSSSLQKFFEKMEDGYSYKSNNIYNFLEGDFYSWYADKQQWSADFWKLILSVIKCIDQYSAFSFNIIYQPIDIFKDLYMSIIPKSIRHSMGEYFTPEWLSDYIVTEGLSHITNEHWKAMDKTTPRLIQFHTFKNAANPPFLGGFSIFSIVAA